MGKFIVQANAAAGRTTFVLVRESTLLNSTSPKSELIQSFRDSGVNFILGNLYDHESLVRAVKQADVVISTVGYAQLNDQVKIIAAIKEAEFGNDVDRSHPVEPAKSTYSHKAQLRRIVETSGVPYTYVSSNLLAGILKTFGQVDTAALVPPRDKVVILGDGNMKAVYNKVEDIAKYTIRAMDDPRTLNKILYIRPRSNSISLNDLATLWENKCGIKLQRVYILEEQVLKNIRESSAPLNLRLAINHSVFVNGDQTNFEIFPSFGVEASELYPDVKYTTVDEMLNQYL